MWESTLKNRFHGRFELPVYRGEYTGNIGDTARRDFSELTNNYIIWAQVHGKFKNAVKQALFEPYPCWEQLYESVKKVLAANIDNNTQDLGDVTNAKLMGDVMAYMRAKYGLNAPRWWLPIMNTLRERKMVAR
jgi:hypothetical protein